MLFQVLNLVRVYVHGHGFYELSRKLMRKYAAMTSAKIRL